MIAIARAERGTSRRVQIRSIAVREARLRDLWLEILQSWSRIATPSTLRAAATFGAVDLSSLSRRMGLEAERRTDQLVEALTLERISRQNELEEFLTPLGPVNVETLARQQIGERVVELEAGALKSLRTQLVIVMQDGPTDAVLSAIAQTTGLTVRQTRAVANFQRRLLEQGVGASQASGQAAAYARRSLRRRARLIARTEAVRFTANIVEERGRQVGNMTKQWVSARDGNVEDICQSLDNGQRVRVGQFFEGISGSILRPPAHPGCRCVLELATGRPKRGRKRPKRPRARRPAPPPPPIPRKPAPRATGDARTAAEVGADLETIDNRTRSVIGRIDARAAELRATQRQYEMNQRTFLAKLDRLERGLGAPPGSRVDRLFGRKPAAILTESEEWVRLSAQLERVEALIETSTTRVSRHVLRSSRVHEARRRRLRAAVSRAPGDRTTARFLTTADTGQHASGAEAYRKLVSNKWLDEANVFVNKTIDPRSYQSGQSIFMNALAADDVVVHELGHILEHFHDEVRFASKRFLARRTKGDLVRSLKDLVPGSNYGLEEIAFPDAFISPYVGKVYPIATEVVSMGLEYMYRDAVEFWLKDPDHFRYIWDIMRGIISATP